MLETEQILARLHARPSSSETPIEMLSHPLTATADRLSETLGPFARVRTVSSACSSGANAIVIAATWLLLGEVDAVVAGGTDGLCHLTLSGFNALGVIDPEPCRPFDRRRRGMSLGEGAGFLVLENAAHALARGRAPVAELAGWAVGSEAHHLTNPAPDARLVAGLIDKAVARAHLSPKEIDYVNAHGTGTQLNDQVESAALARALGAEVRRIPVSSSKAQIGHTLGAAGAIEAVITALAVARRTVLPTAGLEDPDPAIELVHVQGIGRAVPRIRAAISNAFGFGGMDTVLVFCEPRPAEEGDVRRVVASGNDTSCPSVVTGVSLVGDFGRLGLRECARLLERSSVGPPLWGVDVVVDPDGLLDPVRSRRLDRAARLVTVATEHALSQSAEKPLQERTAFALDDGNGTGLIVGSAFGNVNGCAAFMHRVFEKGPRSASPTDFPNLVPSSAAGHVSIYAVLHGPAFATADLSTSGEGAFAQAVELVEAGEASRMVAATVETRSQILDRVSALFAHAASQTQGEPSDLAAAIVVETGRAVQQRRGQALANVVQILQWRDDVRTPLASLRGPSSKSAEVILARADEGAEALLDQTPWRPCQRFFCARALGESDALGGATLAVAAARVGVGIAREALVLGLARSRGYAIVLAAP
jgi:3-oxoacyl-[acyl-carrier-protein] synthase II